jgi:hypothetical protein
MDERVLFDQSMPACSETSWSKTDEIRPKLERSFQINRVSLQEVSRSRFADLLRVAFPAPTDAGICRKAADALGYSERTVKNWLHEENSPPFDVVFAIGCFVGVFQVMEVITQGQSRSSMLGLIARGAGRVFGH